MVKEKKQRYFGTTKIRTDQKLSFISKEDKNGWSLGLALGKRTVWLTGIRFKSELLVEQALGSNVIFIHLKGKK